MKLGPRQFARLWIWMAAGVVLAGLCLVLTGCRSDADVQRALEQGRREGMMQAMPQEPVVFVRGRVAHPVVPWVEGLTLAEALVQADYLGMLNPHRIVVVRRGVPYEIDPRRLLRGSVNPVLEPGDIIELQP